MIDSFEKKVRAAAVAGWWVVLAGSALLLISWGALLGILSARPAWMLALWGHGEVTWELIQTLSLWLVGVWKLILWILVLASLWLTLWARELRKPAGQETR